MQDAVGADQVELMGTPGEVWSVASMAKSREPIVPSENMTSSEKQTPSGSVAIKRSRAGKGKSKTGCRTCKFRRVKCDEDKPICLRCVNFGVGCDGYDIQAAIKPPSQPRQLLPQPSGRLLIQIAPKTAVFQDQWEYQYFRHFREEVALDLSGTVPQPMWNSVLLRACNDSLPLRDLTTSIAALSVAKNSTVARINTNKHRMVAARYYGRALRGVQAMINTTNEADAVRITLLASLLIFCFESLQGEHVKAIAHIKMAMSMMRSRFSTFRRQYSLVGRITSIPGLEDEIVDTFAKINNIVMSRMNSPSDRGILQVRYEIGDGYMPETFRDFAEANKYLNHHMFCAMPYIARLPHVFMNGPEEQSAEQVAMGSQHLDQIRQWSCAFAPLWAPARKSPVSRDFIAAATLRCLGIVSEMSVRKIAGTVDPFIKEATEIVDLTRRVVTNPNYRKTFVFDCGILPALFITVMLCPVRSIREEIVQVLRLAEGRLEVTWDAVEVASMAEMFMRVEPQNSESFMKESSALGGLFEPTDFNESASRSEDGDIGEAVQCHRS